MYSNMENISSMILKKSENFRFLSHFYTAAIVKGVEKNFFSDFFKTMLEMFSILEYISQNRILAEKNYLRCFRRVSFFFFFSFFWVFFFLLRISIFCCFVF